ncbi:MAG: 6-carboxytetrahydropterin synthase [Acidobacteriota bacterium]|jgi:6-pyruvoyltetrahydropterin/6-carboxytetrahydropterin synthase
MPVVTICRRISFSSGHRYFNPSWSEAENRRVYGSSYSESGDGHNFVLEAMLEGDVDPHTGMIVNLKQVDSVLKEVTAPLDHHFLNSDVPHFEGSVPTAENIALYCLEELRTRIDSKGVHLTGVRLYEGPDFWVECRVEADAERED